MKDFLNGPGSDPKVRSFLAAGEKDGAKVDEKIPFTDTGKRVGDLQPTQSEIEFMNSVSYPLVEPGAMAKTRSGGVRTSAVEVDAIDSLGDRGLVEIELPVLVVVAVGLHRLDLY